MISSIFESSVVKDIKYFAQLKTIGTTKTQLKTLLIYQGLLLSCIAIPLSVIINLFTIDIFIDSLTSLGLNVEFEGIQTTSLIAIFLAIAFSLFTIYISILRSYYIIRNRTPIETYRYSEKIRYKKRKHSKLSIFKMGSYNAKRNRFKFYSVVISLAIIPIILSSFLSIALSYDQDKYIEGFSTDTDVIISSSYSSDYSYSDEASISKKDIDLFKEVDKFEEGSIYYDTKESEIIAIEGSEQWNYRSSIYVMDEFILDKYTIKEGKIDYNKLTTENYVIVFDSSYEVGEEITIVTESGDEEEFEIMAIVEFEYVFSKMYWYMYSMDLIMSAKSNEQIGG